MVQPRRSHRLPVLILLTAGLATGVACGGSGSGDGNGVASIRTASDKSTDSDTSDQDKNKAQTNPEDAMLAFARCMRDNGVDMPDPDTSGGAGVVTFRAGPASGGHRIDADRETFEKAHEACKDLMGDAGPMNLTPEQQQEMQDQALAFARCMREQGVNMPDPSFGEKGQMMMKLDPATGLDPNDAKFQAAQQACGSAFGPAGAKAGAGLSVGGGKANGAGAGEGPRGAIMFGSPSASTAGGGAK
ncbi:MAG TPA: hypothetical protein VEG38_17740 [Acidimicrobiia bacterium]|nr:hypothetical protein [Acidimicrobiia bacterium]